MFVSGHKVINKTLPVNPCVRQSDFLHSIAFYATGVKLLSLAVKIYFSLCLCFSGLVLYNPIAKQNPHYSCRSDILPDWVSFTGGLAQAADTFL